MRLITVPASWVAVGIASDNKCIALDSVAELWYYVLWVCSKCGYVAICISKDAFIVTKSHPTGISNTENLLSQVTVISG